MITITLPEWFLWLLVVLAILEMINVIAGLYLKYLNEQIRKAKHKPKRAADFFNDSKRR